MWPFTRKRSLAGARLSSSLVVPEPVECADIEASDSHPIDLQLFELPSEGRIPVVGESHYQQALSLAVGGKVAGEDFESHLPVVAALVPEPDNPWDTNAVRVDIVSGLRTLTVGYLERPVAEEYQQHLLKLRAQGRLGVCPARVTGGGHRYYGIYLHLVWPEKYGIATGAEDPEIAEEKDGVALLRADWSCTVTKEEAHQDVLGAYAPHRPGESRTVRASLGFCLIQSGKYKGEQAIEVRIDGRRVGQLTHAMSTRYRDMIDRVLARGLVPTCEAFTVESQRGVEIELLLPPDPTRSPRPR